MEDETPDRMPARIPKFVSLLFLAAGIFIYLGWISMDITTFNDIGLVSVTLMFLAAGVIGFWHYSNLEREQELEKD